MTATLAGLSFTSIDGRFGGNLAGNGWWKYATQKSDCYENGELKDEPDCAGPRPPEYLIEKAKNESREDENTGKKPQPYWLSVLEKRTWPLAPFKQIVQCVCCIEHVTLTRAQYIWWVNFLCAIVHTTFVVLVLREGLPKGDKMNAPVFRLSSRWNSTAADGWDVSLVDNGMPIRIDFLTASFFGGSALTHLLLCLFGPFDHSIPLLWRNLDLCFMWWRWLEYGITAPIMIVCLCLITGLREQNALAAVFVLMAVTMACGFLTEYWSRPYEIQPGDVAASKEQMQRTPGKYFDEKSYSTEDGGVDLPGRLVGRYDMHRWQGDPGTPVDVNVNGGMLSNADKAAKKRGYESARWSNYKARMLPFVLGIFPYVTCWVIVLTGFFQQLEDLRLEDQALYDRVPRFVPFAVVGTAITFTTFALPQLFYQNMEPQYYWKTEIWYCLLSLTAKVYLGTLLYINVIGAASFEDALALDGGLNATATR